MRQGRAPWLSSRRRKRPGPPSPQTGATAPPEARSSPRRARRSRKTSTTYSTRSTTSSKRTPRSSSRATATDGHRLRSRLRVDLRRLEVFAKVAELGSFSRAADALSLTQPTVSEHVRTLEDEIGVQLLDRLGRGATPTHAGRILLDYARRMLALQREARQALDQFQGRMSGELVVGGSTIPGEYVLPALIGRFKGKYPDISICLLIGSSRQVTEWVEAGRGVVRVVGVPPGPKALVARGLMADELAVIVPARHAWAGAHNVNPAGVKHEALLGC